MNEKDIKNLIFQTIEESNKNSLYQVSTIPFHLHNGIDTPKITFISLADVPSSYQGKSGNIVTVKTNETGLQFSSNVSANRYLIYRIIASTTTDATGTTVGGDWVAPFSGTITDVGATVDTAGTTGTTQIDINKNGSTIMTSTKITIDSTEKTSRTAATPPVLTTTSFSTGDIFTFDVDTVQTTPALGLSIFMNFTQS